MKATTVEIAIIKAREPVETPLSLYVAALSFTVGAAMIFWAIVRWFLLLIGSHPGESSSLMILLIGFALFALGGHSLDVYEAHERANR